MNPKKTVGCFGYLLVLLTTSEPLSSQSTSPASVDAARSNGEGRIEMSPFVVDATRDTGYQATTTLAGTRLNTPVKDIGAAISIYTKDFLEDIGATNVNELLVFATSMEAAGPGGNYSGSTNDVNATEVVGNGPRVDPQQGTRTRGLSSPTFTRGFFGTAIPMDSYNTERVTVNRGPNAILFGVGSPAGIVDTSLIRPDLQRNQNKVETRFGNNASLRGAVDFNRVVLDRKLAFRLAAMHDREKFNQRPAFEERKRIYGAVTYEPLKSTSLRANFETGRTRANRPITVLPYNSISEQWLAAGRPGFDWTFYDDPARNPNAAAQNADNFLGFVLGPGQIAQHVAIIYTNATDTTPTSAFRPMSRVTNATAENSVRTQIFHPLFNRDLAGDAVRFTNTLNVREIPAGFWTAANVPAGQQPGMVPAGIKSQGFTDFSAFDFENRMIDETSSQGDSFHAFNIALEQRAWRDRIGIELAYDTQRADRHAINSFFSNQNTNQIRVDTNMFLSTGLPNPNLGRPFAVYGQGNWTKAFSERETLRGTGYLKYDFKAAGPSWAKWLGRHTLTGLAENNAVETISYSYNQAIDGPAARDISPNIDLVPTRQPRAVVYIGPSMIGNDRPLQLEAVRIPPINSGPLAIPVSYFVRQANDSDPGAFVDSSATLVDVNRGGSAQREVIKSQAIVLQSYWLEDHLITLFGWRRDEDYFVRENINFIPNPANTNDPGKVHYGFNDFSFARTPSPNAAKEIKTYSAVLRWPRQLLKLPAGADVSVFYNKSENFTPIGGRVDGFGVTQASPQGKTREYGFNLSALSDKVSLRVNWFETGVQGQTFTPGVYGAATYNLVPQIAILWAQEVNTNPHLAARAQAEIDLLFSALPPNYRQLYSWNVTGTPPNVAATTSPLSGSGDTTDFTAKGTELDLVFNPTRNWRILANVARQETVQSNSLPFLKRFMALMAPVWDQLRDRPRNNYPLNWQPGDPIPASFQTYGSALDTSVTVPFATAIATEGSASAEQRKWRANLVTNYSFGRDSIFGEKLNGWAVGGAVRWQDKIGIGYPSTRNPDGSVNLDLAHPYYAPAETNVDAWVSYQRKVHRDRINWKVQLNVRNLYRDSTPIAIGVQPWGSVSTVRLAPEQRWYVTNTFSF
jgi:hypothetical protein